MSAHRLLHGARRGQDGAGTSRAPVTGRQAMAVAAVALMLVSYMVVLSAPIQSEPEAYVGDSYTVIYQPGTVGPIDSIYNGSGSYTDLEVVYHGVPYAEYNPQFWAGSVDGNDSEEDWYPIRDYAVGTTVVFTGWEVSVDGVSKGTVDPGEDLSGYFSGGAGVTLTATWGTLVNHSISISDVPKFSGGDKYTNIVTIKGNNATGNLNRLNDTDTDGVRVGATIRSYPGQNNTLIYGGDRVSIPIGVDLIIDNIQIEGTENAGSRSHGSDKAIFANGNRVIIGTGVTSTGGVQVYGGANESSASVPSVASTDLRIFSGTYLNIVGGSRGGNSNTAALTTSVTILGGKVLDTVYGGCENDSNSIRNVAESNVLIAGGSVCGDTNKYDFKQGYEAVIGGSRYGTVGTTNVTVTGNAEVFMVQGGGRSGSQSHVGTTNVVVSGEAEILYMVCGSVTDGNDGGISHFPVDSANLTVRDSAVIGNPGGSGFSEAGVVFGGGWDTWTDSYVGSGTATSSTRTTAVTISGNPQIYGSVFGGGFRGSVGDSANAGVDAVTVSVSGGTVHGDVYGGGRGGADPLDNSNSGTGQSYVYGSVSVNISGKASVNGSVYGGGQGVSVPANETYRFAVGTVYGSTSVVVDGASVGGSVYGGGAGVEGQNEIAAVTGTASVLLDHGSSVGGSVYGGGEFGSVGGSTNVTVYSTVHGSVYGGGSGSPKDVSQASVGDTATVHVMGTVRGDVYGGGELASVAGATVSLNGASVTGSVYGGGSGVGGVSGSASVSGATSVSLASSTVEGDVYGGGRGVLGDGDTASVAGNVTVTISDGSKVSGSVYGGGMYGRVGPSSGTAFNSIIINLTGADTYIDGNVHAGGLGSEGRLSVNAHSRTVTINGPSIGGSVFGGSRFGDDNFADDTVLGAGTATIQFVSGNLLCRSSGNIYGGGYRGYSAMDTFVYVGTKSAGTPLTKVLRVNSVYGGSSVGASDSSMNNAELLIGDSVVQIGGTAADYTDLVLKGDVFGSGDYCEITGTSEVLFEDFDQGDAEMLSIQKATELRIVDSEINLAGNLDGTTTGGSPKLSLNRIGHLCLESTGKTGSRLTMDAATSEISGYTSSYGSGVPDASSPVERFNGIRMNGGMVFSILGGDNRCADMGPVSGYTLFMSDANSYYGAFVIAGRAHLDAAGTGFYVLDNGVLVPADSSDFTYSFGDGIEGNVRAWFLGGAYSVEGTAMITQGVNDNSASITVDVPKIRQGSEIWYVGYYVNAESPGSLHIVPAGSHNVESAINVSVVIGKGEDSGHLSFGDNGLDLGVSGDKPVRSENGGQGNVRLPIDIKISDNRYNTSGFIGTVTIHLAEMNGGIITDVFDVEVGVYIMASLDEDSTVSTVITDDVVLRPTDSGNASSGYVDVYLPVLPGNATGAYYVTSGTDLGHASSLSLNTVPTNVSKNGWFDSRWDSAALELKQGGSEELLGHGGVYTPVVRVHLESSDLDQGGYTKFFVDIRDEVTGSTLYSVEVHLRLVSAPTVEVTILDHYLDVLGDGSLSADKWTATEEIVSFHVTYGESLDSVYVAYKPEMWVKTDMQAFYESVRGSMYKSLNAEEKAEIVTGSHGQLYDLTTQGYTVCTVEEFLQAFIKAKPDTVFSDGGIAQTFDYSTAGSWYDTDHGYSRFNMGSAITADTDIYGGYSIIIDIKVRMPAGDTNTVTANPSQLFPGAPGVSLDLNQVHIALSDGYAIDHWEFEDGTVLPDPGNFTSYSSSTTIYACVEKVVYHPTVEFVKSDGSPFTEGSMVSHTSDLGVNNGYHFDSGVVTISVSIGEGYHISSVSGHLSGGGSVAVSVDGSGDLAFNSTAGDVTIVVTVSDRYHVTVTMPTGMADNDMFSLSYDEAEGSFGIVTGGATKTVTVEVSAADFILSVNGASYSEGGRSNDLSYSVRFQDGWSVLHESVVNKTFAVGTGITLELYVNVEWTLVVPADADIGYTHSVRHLDPLGGTISDDVKTVRTGDRVTLTCLEDYGFSQSFTAVGVTGGQGDTERVYTVVGKAPVTDASLGVQFGKATLMTMTLTVTVYFGGSPAAEPAWTLSIDGKAVDPTRVSYADYTGVYKLKLNAGRYLLQADFQGYKDISAQVDVISGRENSVTVYAVPVLAGEGAEPEPEDTVVHLYTHVSGANGEFSLGGAAGEGEMTIGGATFSVSGSTLTVSGFSDGMVGSFLLGFRGVTVVLVVVPDPAGAAA